MKCLGRRSLCLWIALAFAAATPYLASADVVLEEASWTTEGGLVSFNVRFFNTDPLLDSEPMLCQVSPQETYGAFVQTLPVASQFDIPPIPPESFFDVFFDIPEDALPPSAERIRETMAEPGVADNLVPCPPDTNWAGNVDFIWGPPGLPPGLPPGGNVQVHFGTILVPTPGGVAYIHVLVDCIGLMPATWSLTFPFGPCPGWTVSFLQSDMFGMPGLPAPNPLPLSPPAFDGWLCISAGPSVPVGAVCCVDLNVTCPGNANSPATVRLCATACDSGPTAAQPATWGQIKKIYR